MKNTKTEWVSVNDRLPEDISTVIVAVREIAKPTFAWYADLADSWHLLEKDFIKLKDFTVTHWIPMPELPEELENAD